MVLNIKNLNQIRGEKLCKLSAILLSSFLITFIFASIFAPVESSNALTCSSGVTETGDVCSTDGTGISVTVSNPYYITVTSAAGSVSGINLDYTSSSGNILGSLVIASDTVKTTSNTGQAKHLYISTNSNSNNLTNDNTNLDNNRTFISPGGGNTLDEATTLSDNTWGFNIEDNHNFTKVPTLGNDILIQDDTGTYNSETGEYESTQSVYYGALATTEIYAGNYQNTVLYTAFTEEPTIGTIYMQDFTVADCANLAESIAKEDRRITLLDKRDNKPYKVAKLADGNCWMVQNLALDGTDSSGNVRTLTPDDSNVISNYTFPEGVDVGEDATSVKTSPQIYSGASEITDAYGSKRGNHYNIMAATAGQADPSFTGVATRSVCPKGWRLPDPTGSLSYTNLMNAYKLPTDKVSGDAAAAATTKIQQSPLYFPLAETYYNGRVVGANAGYYARIVGGVENTNPRTLSFSSSNFNPVAAGNAREYGLSVRCVLGS